MKALTWTPERTAELTKRYQVDLQTQGEIGRAMGLTKNAIVGKVHRMGLKRIGTPIPKKRPTKLKRAPMERTWNVKPPSVRGLKMRPGEPKPLGEQPGGCLWLHGPSTKRAFCGHERHEKTSYCKHHRERCLIPAPKKKRRGQVIEK